MNRGKKLTAVVAALDTFAEVREALYWLHRQTARDCLEIMVVCEDLTLFELPADAQRQVGPLQLVECGIGKTLAEARAVGCRAAETAFVGFFEDHCFLEPAWCERVLARVEEGWSGVGGAFLSANPQTKLAQAQMLVGYGQWMHPVAAREMPFISGHGSVFNREILMAHDEKLEDFFVAEALMMIELRQQGYRFFCESDVVSWHFEQFAPREAAAGLSRHRTSSGCPAVQLMASLATVSLRPCFSSHRPGAMEAFGHSFFSHPVLHSFFCLVSADSGRGGFSLVLERLEGVLVRVRKLSATSL